ncbi:MAG: hypothetical protein PW788_02130 [Micavibrio sp.]|nr:hypothetical protein [Micavibrio sp.]
MAPVANPQKEDTVKKPATRIARLMLPQVDPNSALLPPDTWIKKTAWDFIKSSKSLHRTAGKAALYAGVGLAGLATAVTGMVMFIPAAPLIAVIVAATSAVVVAAASEAVQKQVKVFKKETLPELQQHVGRKYLEFKMAEMKAAWQRKADERAKEKAAQKAAAAEKAAAAKPAETAAPVTPVTTSTSATTVPAPQTPKSTGGNGGGLGGWMLKKAMEKAAQKQLPQNDNKADAAAVDKKPPAAKPPQP